MRDLSKAIQMQEWSAQEYADARERRAGPHRDILLDYIADNQKWGAWNSRLAREAMGITDDDPQSQSAEGPTYLDFITPDEIFDKGPTAVQEWQDAKRATLFSADNGRAE